MPESHGFIDFRAVKAAVSMEQVLERYGLKEKLRPLGQDSLTGCCPIHKGTNPTQFRVSLSKNCWKCFSDCRAGGNVLDFIGRMEEVPIHKAALLAAEWFNVDAARQSNSSRSPTSRVTPAGHESAEPSRGEPSSEEPRGPDQHEQETAAPNKALAFELKHLNPQHPYFAERGLTPESVDHFGLGYCSKGILNGRVAIPIHNGSGELVAYAGRWPGQPPEQKPKYQLPKGFRKSQEVFNLHRAKAAEVTSPLVIVEGFFDCMKVWLARHPRFHLHFTPTSASWLNMVERFFRDLTVNRLRRGVFHSVPELVSALEKYIAQHNREPKPFIWTAKASDILAKVARARKKLPRKHTSR